MHLMVKNLRPASRPVNRVALPSISYIVARSYPGHIIGCDNKLPWHLKSDLQRFRRITMNNVVIMGRNTLESIGSPLKNRTNIVLSSSPEIDAPGVHLVSSMENALFLADFYSIINGSKESFVIGGASIYQIFSQFFDRIYLTEVFSDEIRGDTHFDYEFDHRQWKVLQEEDIRPAEGDEYPYRFSVYERKRKTTRIINISEFMTGKEQFMEYISSHQAGDHKSKRDYASHAGDLIDKYTDSNFVE